MVTDILSTIARVQRAMPRNEDVMLVCSELEKRLVTVKTTGTREPKLKFDRNAYQRDYMREWRRRQKEAKG